MKRPRDIRKAPEITVDQGGYNGGIGDIKIGDWIGSVMWDVDKDGWDHVSVAPYNPDITPSWDDMCRVKDIFFREDECALQFHPPEAHYINIKGNCLHLWRPTDPALMAIFEGRKPDGGKP